MVATRALLETAHGSEAELRRCIRDLVGLSALPAIWIKADGRQIADGLGQLVLSVLDVDFTAVILREPDLQVVHCHERLLHKPLDLTVLRNGCRANSTFEIDDPVHGRLSAMCVAVGRDAGSRLIAFSRRPDFPGETERMLLRVAANLAAVSIERWKVETQQAEQARVLARLRETENALHTLTDRLFRAQSRDDVYTAGLEAIFRTMHCNRGSILLFDQFGVMRFVAWRGLSAEYRKAVDGHSPWKPEDKDADPLCIDDVDRAEGFSEELKAVVRAERIAALVFIPIVANGVVTGKIMAYYDVPHRFSDEEIDAGVTVARQLGFGLERLRSAEGRQRLSTIVETSDDAIISKNLDGVIQTWNAGAERIFGYTADEVIGKPVTVLMPPDRVNEEPGILARLRRGERIDHYQTVRRRKDGTLIDISLTVSPVRDAAGRIIGASKIARDITDQKRSEAALRESERRLQELLSAIPAAIYTTDAEGRITYYNEAAVELAGRRPTIGMDRWCVSWKLYWPDGTPLPHDQCPMAVALKEGRPVRGKEAVVERPDGTRIPFIPFPTPIRDSTGRVTGAINMLVDVSERKQAETQQQLLLRELNHRVKNNMQMLQSLLSTAMRQTQSQEARKVLEDAARRVTAMAAAQKVLYSTTDATRFNSHEFVQSACHTAQQAFPPNVKIVCEAASVQLDNEIAMPLALILNELLTNAVKYGCTREGDGLIRVSFTEETGTGYLVLSVEDDGPGFDLQSAKTQSSGLKLLQLLARQLRGHFEVTRSPRSRCSLRFASKL
jgi:PAS domain S-box-containing protein